MTHPSSSTCRRGRCAALLAFALAALRAAPARAFIYSFAHNMTAMPAVVFREGPMFASGKGPLGETGASSITLSVTGAPDGSAVVPGTPGVVLNVAFADASSWTQLAGSPGDSSVAPPFTPDYLACCTPAVFSGPGGCGAGVAVGGLVVYPAAAAGAAAPAVTSFVITPDASGSGALAPMQASAAFAVTREGMQYVALLACDVSGSVTRALPGYALQLSVAFRNPYGYLPGQVFGLFPFDGALFVTYLLVLLAYCALLVRHRAHLLQLQLGVLALMALGTLEMAVWFGTYDSKNRTGVPTPCDVCGPVTGDYVVASVLTVFKRALSRCLLLAVALGYGVVRPVLEGGQVARIGALGLAYAVFGVLDEVQKSTTYDSAESAWVLGLLVVDMACFIWTYTSLQKICKDLLAAQQREKLRMYVQLQNVISGCALVYCVMALVILLIRSGATPLDWKSLFFLVNFWDLLYLAVLLAVAYIWAPGESSFLYASYSQPPAAGGGGGGNGNGLGGDAPDTVEEAAEADANNDVLKAAPVRPEAVGIEMTAPSPKPKAATAPKAAAAAAAGAKPLGRPVPRTVQEAEEDEDEFGDDDDNDVAHSAAPSPALARARAEADTRALGAKKAGKVDARPLGGGGGGGGGGGSA